MELTQQIPLSLPVENAAHRSGKPGRTLQRLSVSSPASLHAHDDFNAVTWMLREAWNLTRHADPGDAPRQPFLLQGSKREGYAQRSIGDPPKRLR